jgi:hypothetical protein
VARVTESAWCFAGTHFNGYLVWHQKAEGRGFLVLYFCLEDAGVFHLDRTVK